MDPLEQVQRAVTEAQEAFNASVLEGVNLLDGLGEAAEETSDKLEKEAAELKKAQGAFLAKTLEIAEAAGFGGEQGTLVDFLEYQVQLYLDRMPGASVSEARHAVYDPYGLAPPMGWDGPVALTDYWRSVIEEQFGYVPGARHGGEVVAPGVFRVGEAGEELVYLPRGAIVSPGAGGAVPGATIEIHMTNRFEGSFTREEARGIGESLGRGVVEALRRHKVAFQT